MKKVFVLIFSILCIFAICSCSDPSKDNTAASEETVKSEHENSGTNTEATTPASVENTKASPDNGVIPSSLVFSADGSGGYVEPVLGEWEAFLSEVFRSYDVGELDPGSGNIKYYGEGNDGYGYSFIVTTRSNSGSIISYNIDTAVISAAPDSGGDEISGQDMVRWIYDNFQ